MLHQRRKDNTGIDDPLPSKATVNGNWGRFVKVGNGLLGYGALFMMLVCPLLVIYFYAACTHHSCALMGPLQTFRALDRVSQPFWETLKLWWLKEGPLPSWEATTVFTIWMAWQVLLYKFMPGPIAHGQLTPAGHLLPYKVNGFRAWVVTHLVFLGLSLPAPYGFNLFPTSIVADHWGGLLVAANIFGYSLALFAYIKAHLFPTHPRDRLFSGSTLYDLFMGVELNPRIGNDFDFKLFFNGRPGICGWTVINLSFAAAQYRDYGRVTNSMILLNFLHALYVVDFFWNESWYTRTIDIAHDAFGFYLAWGDMVWLPFMYTLQSHYLLRHAVDLSPTAFGAVLGCGLLGYAIFRLVNDQKDYVRRQNGNCQVWGRPARVIRTQFMSKDGRTHSSVLIACGFWGLSRHFNYVGDLLISFAMCATCGTGYLLPYFYIIYMTILLLHRIERDNTRLTEKYGQYWEEYKKMVPYKLLPFVY